MGVWRLYRRPVSDVNVGPVVKAGVTNHSAGRIVAVAHYVSISIEHLFAGIVSVFNLIALVVSCAITKVHVGFRANRNIGKSPETLVIVVCKNTNAAASQKSCTVGTVSNFLNIGLVCILVTRVGRYITANRRNHPAPIGAIGNRLLCTD